jgi:hypothetical protein
MDDMMWSNTKRTSLTAVAAVLTQLSLVHLHTWQTRLRGRDHGQPD